MRTKVNDHSYGRGTGDVIGLFVFSTHRDERDATFAHVGAFIGYVWPDDVDAGGIARSQDCVSFH